MVCGMVLSLLMSHVAGAASVRHNYSYGSYSYTGDGASPKEGDIWGNPSTNPLMTVVGTRSRVVTDTQKATDSGLPTTANSGGHCFGGATDNQKFSYSVRDQTSSRSQSYKSNGWRLDLGSYPYPSYPSSSKINSDRKSYQRCSYSIAKKFTAERVVKSTETDYLLRLVPFSYTPTTTVDKKFSKPGDVVTFSHRIGVEGTPPSAVNPPTLTTLKERTGPTFNYGYSSIKTLTCKLKPSNCYFDTRNELLTTYSGKTMSTDTVVTIGKDTPEGARICYGTQVAPRDQGGYERTSGFACTTVGNSPANTNQYNLTPSVSMEAASPAEAGELVTMSDQVRNAMKDESAETTWTAFAAEVRSGVDVAPITSTSHDDKTPQAVVDILGKQPNGQPKATLIPAEDTNVNKTGKTTVSGNATKTVGSRSFVLSENAPIGTKFCFFLQVSPVANSGSPVTRTSAAKCITIGKKPKMNIYGGDLSVGRKFANDSSVPSLLQSSIHTSITMKNEDGRKKIYGSWTEYDAYAPGVVSGFGTASGLQGGLETTATDQSQWSKLTFVNVKNSFGSFSSSNTLGTIPDTAAAVTSGLRVAQTIPTETTTLDLGNNKTDLASGIYKKDTGDLTLKGTTLAPGKTAVVAVPNGTVVIDGDLRYGGGPYASLSQVPQLLVIAKNIVIKGSVTNVDAWLIAKAPVGSTPSGESSGPVGQINTCDVTGNLSTSVCNQPLTVTGPVMSNQLVLRRTAGLADPAKNDQPAEVFNLRADAYLWIYQQGTSNTRALTTYNRELPVRF